MRPGEFGWESNIARPRLISFSQSRPRFVETTHLGERHPKAVIQLRVTRGNCFSRGDHFPPLFLGEKLLAMPEFATAGRRCSSETREGNNKSYCEDDGRDEAGPFSSGTASSVQLPAPFHSLSKSDCVCFSNLRSAGSFFNTSPASGSNPTTTT